MGTFLDVGQLLHHPPEDKILYTGAIFEFRPVADLDPSDNTLKVYNADSGILEKLDKHAVFKYLANRT